MSDDRIVETRTESPAWTLPAIVVLGLIAMADGSRLSASSSSMHASSSCSAIETGTTISKTWPL